MADLRLKCKYLISYKFCSSASLLYTLYGAFKQEKCNRCMVMLPHAGSGVVTMDPIRFPGRMSYKATKPGLFLFYILACFFIVLVFIRAPFYVLLVFIVCVLSFGCSSFKLSLLAKLLARKTPLSS